MGHLAASVHHDLGADIALASFVGDLTVMSAPVVRSTLLTCLANCPSAMVVDLREVLVESPTALTVVPALAHHNDFLPHVPMLVCLPRAIRDDGRITSSLGRLPLFGSTEEAMAAAARARHLLRRKELAASMTLQAPGQARQVVRQACTDWGLAHLVNVAELVTSELVTNAIKHARTGVHFEALLRGDFLHLRVRDRSTSEPRLRDEVHAADRLAVGGHGLRLVDIYASGWGYVRSPEGKVVWATLRACPVVAGGGARAHHLGHRPA
jgi:anti-sigma regulatory factor (Ser/Thr protein kinase)